MELREYYDPLDGTLLEVEAVPPGYPVIHSFQPDLEAFYAEWLGRPLNPLSNSSYGQDMRHTLGACCTRVLSSEIRLFLMDTGVSQ
jgi:hypothetical protein